MIVIAMFSQSYLSYMGNVVLESEANLSLLSLAPVYYLEP